MKRFLFDSHPRMAAVKQFVVLQRKLQQSRHMMRVLCIAGNQRLSWRMSGEFFHQLT